MKSGTDVVSADILYFYAFIEYLIGSIVLIRTSWSEFYTLARPLAITFWNSPLSYYPPPWKNFGKVIAMSDTSYFWFASFYNIFAAQTCLEDLSYEPLHSASEIRLLELNKGHSIEPIQCTIRHVSLDNSPGKYMALSYTWGSTEDRRYIACNGKRLSITANLYSALYKFRLADVSVTFWIDAICINQLDVAERESQVRMMRRIYRQAELVVVDLGDAAEGAELIPSLLSKIVKLRNHYGEDQIVPHLLFEEFGLPSAKAPDWNALALLLCRPWFRRVWIIQECALAQDLSMMYGNTVLSWSDLYWALSWLNEQGRFAHIATLGDLFPNGRSVALTGSKNFCKIARIRSGIQRQKPEAISRCLAYVRTFEATDPRDKAYGLLGLVLDVDEFGFQVIYSGTETLENVYFRLAQALVKNGYAYDVLLFAGSYSLLGNPSWVPNWSREQEHVPFSHTRVGENPTYYAGGMEKISATVMKNGRELAVCGNLFDEILLLGDTHHGSSWKEGEGTSPIMNWEAQTKTLVDKLSDYPTCEPVFDVYRRVLVANQDSYGNKASASYIENYESTLRMYQIYEDVKSSEKGGPPLKVDEEEIISIHKSIMDYGLRIALCASERKLCVTKKGYIGLVHDDVIEGDSICVFVGAGVPFVLRECGDGYKLYNDCYIHGIMEGEVIEMQDTAIQDIIIR